MLLCDHLAMLPVLENAEQTVLSVKRLEAENSQLKSAIDQHEADAKKQGNTTAAVVCSCIQLSHVTFRYTPLLCVFVVL